MRIRRSQKAVYWAPDDVNGYGETQFVDPVEIVVRWEDDQQLFIDNKGNEVVSSAIVFPAVPLALGGYLWLGSISSLSSSEEGDPHSVLGAKEIRSINSIPSVDCSTTVIEVLL